MGMTRPQSRGPRTAEKLPFLPSPPLPKAPDRRLPPVSLLGISLVYAAAFAFQFPSGPKMEVAASGETRGDQTDTGVDEISAVFPDAMRPGDRSREYLNEWIENVMKLDPNPSMPPTYIVKHNDLLEECWGWKRLVAYNRYDVQWCDYKKYLGDYFIHNAGKVAILCAKQKPDTVGLGIAAANLCIKREKKLLRYCRDDLAPEDIRLSKDIKNRAKLLMESNDVSSVAAAALVCIAKESKLIYEFLVGCTDWETTRSVAFGNRIRRSAWNLMLYRGSKSADAVAGAMLGLAIEAKLFHGYVVSEGCYFSDHELCCKIRKCTAALLTELEGKLAQETADDEEKSKLEKERSQKKMKLNEGNETKLHTGVTAAVTEELEAEGQPGGEFSEDLSVFVGNLPVSINDAQLTELFAQAGSVKKAKLLEAHERYSRKAKGKKCQFEGCWLTLRHTQKFESTLEVNKRPAKSRDLNLPVGTQQVDDSTAQGQESITSAKKDRPPGRKQSKEKLKKNEGDDEYKDLMQNLMVMKAEEHKMKKKRWEKDSALEQRRIHIEEQRLQWDQEKKIMFCDVSKMDDDQRAYVKAKRAKMVKEMSGSVSETTSGESRV